jgi:hypothetical protein
MTINEISAPWKRTVGIACSDLSRCVIEVEHADGRLSMCGTITRGDGAWHGGQCEDSIEREASEIAAERGGRRLIGEADLSALLDIWRRYHLNYMRPGCEHQRGPDWDVSRQIEFRTYSIDWDDHRQLERTRDRDGAAVGLNPEQGPVGSPAAQRGPLTPREREAFRRYSHAAALLYTLERAGVKPFSWRVVKDARAFAVLSESFEIIGEAELPAYRSVCALYRAGEWWSWKGRRHPGFGAGPKPPILERVERKGVGWVRPEEHPDGLLCKPCKVCGYKYGSEWKREEIPAEVLAELERITSGHPEPPGPDAVWERLGLSIEVARSDAPPPKSFKGCHAYKVTLRRGARSFSLPFYQGSAHTAPPTLADVMDCLRSDAQCIQDDDETVRDLGLTVAQLRQAQKQTARVLGLLGDDAATLGFPVSARKGGAR